jgi:RNA polymerase primary sigma factor
MIDVCFQDDDGVTHRYGKENSPALLSDLDQPDEYPAEADGPAPAPENLATATVPDNDNDQQNRDNKDAQGRDPIKAYLRQMSTTPLLTRDGEVELGKRIEEGHRLVLRAILNSTASTRRLIELGRTLGQQATQLAPATGETDEHSVERQEVAGARPQSEQLCKVMADVQRMQVRLARAESDTTSAVETTRERGRREVATIKHEMADALLTLRLDPKHLAGIIAQLRSLMDCIVAARADIDYCESRGRSRALPGGAETREGLETLPGFPNQRLASQAGGLANETEQLAGILDNAKRAIRLVEEEVAMPEQVLRDTLKEIRRGELQAEMAKAEMVKRNLRLVIFIAKKYINHSELHFMDLVQEGNIGLIKAVERYDYKMGFKFATYAIWWIRQAITFALNEQSRTIRIPVHIVEATNKVRRTHRQLVQRLGREVSAEEVAKEMDLSVEKIHEVLSASERTVSLDTPIGPDGDAHLGDFIEDPNVTSALDSVVSTGLAEQTRKILATLSSREQEVLRLRFGFDEAPAQTLEEVGRNFDLTRERVRQIEAKALETLRRRACGLGLAPSSRSFIPTAQ